MKLHFFILSVIMKCSLGNVFLLKALPEVLG